jgi:hypothetical protein
MTTADLKKIVATALDVDPREVADDASTETLEAWDSLGHVAIVVALDEALDGRVAGIDGIRKAYSLPALAGLLRGQKLLD